MDINDKSAALYVKVVWRKYDYGHILNNINYCLRKKFYAICSVKFLTKLKQVGEAMFPRLVYVTNCFYKRLVLWPNS